MLLFYYLNVAFCFLVVRASKVLAIPLENGDVQVHASIDQRPCEVEHCGCPGLSFSDLNWTRHAVEPRTGIEFPMFLDNIVAGQERSRLTSEVDVSKFHVIALNFMRAHYVLT
jgi:hypothetical protein